MTSFPPIPAGGGSDATAGDTPTVTFQLASAIADGILSGSTRLAPSRGVTWSDLGLVLAGMAYKGTVVMAAEEWAADAEITIPSGTHLIIEKGATIEGTIEFSEGTIAQNAIFYNNGGTTDPTAETTLAADAAAGDVELELTSEVGFDVGGWFRIITLARTRTYLIIAKDGNTITIDRPLRRPFAEGDDVQAIPAARDITIEGNGVQITGQADALVQIASGVNCHLLDIDAAFEGKFGACFDLGTRDSTMDNVRVDSLGITPGNILVANSEDIDLYDCVGVRAGVPGSGLGVSILVASSDNVRGWGGSFTESANSGCELTAEDASDTFGVRGSGFNGTFFGKATGAAVQFLNGSSFNTFTNCDASDSQSGWSFTGGSAAANGNELVGCRADRNSVIGFGANAATVNRLVACSGEGNVVGFAEISAGADLEFVAMHLNDTSEAVPGQGLILATGAGSRARIVGGYATSSRAVCHLVEVAAGAKASIDGGTRYVAAGANCALVLVAQGVASLGKCSAETPAGFGVYLNGAAAYARIGDQADLSGAGTPLSENAGGKFNRGQIALTAAVNLAVAFGDTKATDRFFWSYATNVGATGVVIPGAPVVATGFTIVGLAGDTSLINYEIR